MITTTLTAPLISSQRYINQQIVASRVARFKRFVVNIHPVTLRGKNYTLLMDGHHNYTAAKLAGIAPIYQPVGKKLLRILKTMSAGEIEAFLINNITDSHYYYVETGEVVPELVMPETSHKFTAHAGNQWIFGGQQ